MRGGTGTRRRSSTGGGAEGGEGIFGGGGGDAAGFISETHWLTRPAVSPIFSAVIFNPLNSALARDPSSPTSAPMEGICRDGGAGTLGRSSTS